MQNAECKIEFATDILHFEFCIFRGAVAMTYTENYIKDLVRVQAAVPCWERLAGRRVLVTGAGGLICSALVDLLMARGGIHVWAAGRDVEKLRRRFSHWEGRPELHFVQYDALNPLSWEGDFDFFVHGASNANPAAYSAQPVETMMANILGLERILRYAADRGGRVLYVSSSEVYGKKEGPELYGEQDYGFVDLLHPRACYPSAKRAAETLCAAYAAEYGVEAVIVRPGHIYGPTATASDDRASTQFPREVLAGKDIVMKSAGTQLRSYCYVLDCVSAMAAVLTCGESGRAYNISNKNSLVTIRQMAQAFADAAGRQLTFADPTDAERRGYNLMENSGLDATALEALGWHGMFDLEAGVKATLDAMN